MTLFGCFPKTHGNPPNHLKLENNCLVHMVLYPTFISEDIELVHPKLPLQVWGEVLNTSYLLLGHPFDFPALNKTVSHSTFSRAGRYFRFLT